MITIPKKTLQCGFSMPEFGMGTWMMGGAVERDPNDDGEAAVAAIRRGLDLGITAIDTAEMYAGGFSEEIVGRAIAGYRRESLFITSKVWNNHLDYHGVIRAAEGSLRRLKTDYLDLYLIHKPNDEFPMAETFRAMDWLVENRLVRYIGVSNFALPRLKQARNLAEHPIVANQVHYNLVYRQPEAEGLVDYAKEHDLMLIAWRPLQKGALMGEGAVLLEPLAQKYHKTPAQIALNWVLCQPNTATMSTMRNTTHLEENLGAVGWRLQKADIRQLAVNFPVQKLVSDVVSLS